MRSITRRSRSLVDRRELVVLVRHLAREPLVLLAPGGSARPPAARSWSARSASTACPAGGTPRPGSPPPTAILKSAAAVSISRTARGILLPRARQQLDAVELRHHEVRDHHVEVRSSRGLAPGRCASRPRSLRTGGSARAPCEDQRVVVHHEDAVHRSYFCRSCELSAALYTRVNARHSQGAQQGLRASCPKSRES